MVMFNGLMIGVFVFAALMVLFHFAFYKRQENARQSAYFWGGILFLALAVTDVTSSLLYRTDLHEAQTMLFLGLTGWALYQSKREKVKSS